MDVVAAHLEERVSDSLLTAAQVTVDVVAAQMDLTLMNHSLGPNMPLARLRVLDAYAGLRQTGRGNLQLDLQLPLEAMSYSVKQHAFETLLEPSLLGLRVLVVPAQYNTDMLGETLEVAPVAFKVWAR